MKRLQTGAGVIVISEFYFILFFLPLSLVAAWLIFESTHSFTELKMKRVSCNDGESICVIQIIKLAFVIGNEKLVQ